jgi:glucosamine-phosphate N-acetyltransferase
LDALSHLSLVGKLTRDDFLQRFYEMKAQSNTYYTIVIEDTEKKRIAATGSIIIEKKFLHRNGLAGHIEDIVVHDDYRGKNFGKWIIEQLKMIGDRVGTYKIILDCSEKNVPFYIKCGFAQKEVEMVLYLEHHDAAKSAIAKL